MTHVYRITKGPDVGDIVDSAEAFSSSTGDHGPDRYDVDEHAFDPFPRSNVAARAWGKVVHHNDVDR